MRTALFKKSRSHHDDLNESMKTLVIGAGVMGLVLSHTLKQNNHHVTLIEKDKYKNPQSCSFVAGGMLAPYCELDHSEKIIYDLGIQSLPLWKKISQTLNSDIGLIDSGTEVIATHYEKAELQFLKNELSKYNLNVFEQQPEQNGFEKIYFKNEGALDPKLFFKNMRLKILESLDEFSFEKTVHPQNAKEDYDLIFDCTGLSAKPNLKNLRGVRGEVLRVYCSQVQMQRVVRFMHPRYPIYIIPRQNHEFTVGASHCSISRNLFREKSRQ